MKALITLKVHVLCEEEEVERFRTSVRSLPSFDEVIATKLVDEELIEDGIDAEKLVSDRYKDVGI